MRGCRPPHAGGGWRDRSSPGRSWRRRRNARRARPRRPGAGGVDGRRRRTRTGDGTEDRVETDEQGRCACRYCQQEFREAARAREHINWCGAAPERLQDGSHDVDDEVETDDELLDQLDGEAVARQDEYLIRTAPHEFRAFLKYGAGGLDPYYALHAKRKAYDDWGDGGPTTEYEYNGRRFEVELTYNPDNPILPWDDDSFAIEEVYEYRINVSGPNDHRSFSAKISPRWPDMETAEGSPSISNPRDFVGLDIDLQGSNIPFEVYPEHIEAAMQALDVAGEYQDGAARSYYDPATIEDWSTIVDVPSTGALSMLLECESVSVMAIAHDGRRWLDRLDPAVYEQFHPGHVPLMEYSVDQVADILERRVEHGLRGNPVERQQLEAMGREADGVAREAIKMLEAATELATERGHDVIRDADVDDAYERARHKIRLANVRSLPYHHQVLYALIHNAGVCTAQALHERYDAVSEDVYRDVPQMPVKRRARRKKLTKLEDYDLIAIEGETSDRRYRVRDAAVEPPIEVPAVA